MNLSSVWQIISIWELLFPGNSSIKETRVNPVITSLKQFQKWLQIRSISYSLTYKDSLKSLIRVVAEKPNTLWIVVTTHV